MTANANFPNLSSSKVASVWNDPLQTLADEGVLYIATNPTPNTPIAMTTSVVSAANTGATAAQTQPVMLIYNSNQQAPSNIVNVYPLLLNMQLNQVPTSATSWQMAMWLDPIGSNAYSTGGSVITPVALNQSLGGTSRAQIYFGAITANPTTAGGKLISRRQINPVIPVTLDQWFFTFGSVRSSDQIASGTGAKNLTLALPPVVIPPQWALKIGMWGASNAAAPSWEFELIYAERPAGQ